MKYTRQIVTSILSVYLLLLSVVPCNDVHSKVRAIARTEVSEHGEDHHNVEICTPFCVCSNCVAAVMLQPIAGFEIPCFEQQHYRPLPSFYESIVSSFYGSIWQPPQLV